MESAGYFDSVFKGIRTNMGVLTEYNQNVYSLLRRAIDGSPMSTEKLRMSLTLGPYCADIGSGRQGSRSHSRGRSNSTHRAPETQVVSVPAGPHLIGELSKTPEGCNLLSANGMWFILKQCAVNTSLETKIRCAALWSVSHIAATECGYRTFFCEPPASRPRHDPSTPSYMGSSYVGSPLSGLDHSAGPAPSPSAPPALSADGEVVLEAVSSAAMSACDLRIKEVGLYCVGVCGRNHLPRRVLSGMGWSFNIRSNGDCIAVPNREHLDTFYAVPEPPVGTQGMDMDRRSLSGITSMTGTSAGSYTSSWDSTGSYESLASYARSPSTIASLGLASPSSEAHPPVHRLAQQYQYQSNNEQTQQPMGQTERERGVGQIDTQVEEPHTDGGEDTTDRTEGTEGGDVPSGQVPLGVRPVPVPFAGQSSYTHSTSSEMSSEESGERVGEGGKGGYRYGRQGGDEAGYPLSDGALNPALPPAALPPSIRQYTTQHVPSVSLVGTQQCRAGGGCPREPWHGAGETENPLLSSTSLGSTGPYPRRIYNLSENETHFVLQFLRSLSLETSVAQKQLRDLFVWVTKHHPELQHSPTLYIYVIHMISTMPLPYAHREWLLLPKLFVTRGSDPAAYLSALQWAMENYSPTHRAGWLSHVTY
ncbi:hypothetical protein KIPB_002072 [Kipferlia bialata]|uniref:Uncharacterized protein n=1 Tax=Kipferlia bialata TaxID=797122 RepID=A0A9K3CRJ9_9EUKA|nr:hypothetical protein KIPB_002072 [Kipferlia bialata]|eukprot:g2072.t1